MQPLHGLRERSEAMLRAKRRIVPFGHLWHELERRRRRAAYIAGRQPFGQRIDRIEIGKIRQSLFVEHPVRVHHLQPAVIERDLARHPALLAEREHLFEPIRGNVEIDDLQRASIVLGENSIWRAPAAGLVPVDRHSHGSDRVGHDFGELRPRAPVDGGIGEMKQQVDHPRLGAVEQALIEFQKLRPDAGQLLDGSEQWVQDRGAHLKIERDRTAPGAQPPGPITLKPEIILPD